MRCSTGCKFKLFKICDLSTTEIGAQNDPTDGRFKIWKMHNCTSKIKSTYVEVSVKCTNSNQISPVAVQRVSSSFYGHKYYLTKEETIKADPSWRN